MTNNVLDFLHEQFDRVHGRLDGIDRRLDAIDVRLKSTDRNITLLLQDTRMIRAAVNDIAREHVSAGEIEALHEDVTRLTERMSIVEVRLDQLEK